jgi:hypothetical protein
MIPKRENSQNFFGGSRWLLALPVIVWIFGVVIFFTRIDIPGFFSEAPFYQENFPKYFYHIDATTVILRETGSFWGYDPNFAAGIPESPGNATVAHILPSLLCALTGLPSPIVLKAIITVFFIAFPWLIYSAARRFGLAISTSALIMLFDVFFNLFAVRYRFMWVGMGMYFSSIPILVYLISYLFPQKVSARFNPIKTMLIVAAFGVLLAYWHILQIVLFTLVVALHLAHFRTHYLTLKGFLSLSLAIAIIAVATWPWLYPLIKFHITLWPFWTGMLEYMGLNWLGPKSLVYFPPILFQPLMIFTLVLGIASYFNKCVKRQNGVSQLFFMSVIVMIFAPLPCLTLISSTTASMRFLDILPFCMLIIAGKYAEFLWTERRFKRLIWLGILGTLVVVIQLLAAQRISLTPKFVTTPPPEYTALETWLRDNTTNEARIAFESHAHRENQPIGFDAIALLARDVPRQYVAIPSHESAAFMYHAFLFEGRIGPHDLARLSSAQTLTILDAYNIGWVVAVTERSKQVFENLPELFESLTTISGYQIYRAKREHSYFLSGKGRIKAYSNRLVLQDLQKDGSDRITIAYHFDPCLTAEPNGRILKEKSPVDSFGFITLETNKRNLEIFCDTSRGYTGVPKDFRFKSLK